MPSKFELFKDISSLGNEFQTAAWNKTNFIFSALENGLGPAPNSFDLASIFITDGTAGANDIWQQFFPPGGLAGKTFEVGIWAKAPIISDAWTLFIAEKDRSTGFASITSTGILSDHTLLRIFHTFSTGFVDSGFSLIMRLDAATDSGDSLSVWRGHASHNRITNIEPEFDYAQRDEKIQDMHITRDGSRFTYKWGDRFRLKFSQRFVSSQTQSLVNSWWNENTKLLWVVDCGIQVESVQITNKNLPIGQFVLPHDTLYRGSIELETY